MTFYDRLMQKLDEKKKTRADLCAFIGISKSSATHWSSGGIPSADVAVKIAEYCGCTVEYLITGNELDINPESLALIKRIDALDPRLKICLIHNLESFEEIQQKMQK